MISVCKTRCSRVRAVVSEITKAIGALALDVRTLNLLTKNVVLREPAAPMVARKTSIVSATARTRGAPAIADLARESAASKPISAATSLLPLPATTQQAWLAKPSMSPGRSANDDCDENADTSVNGKSAANRKRVSEMIAPCDGAVKLRCSAVCGPHTTSWHDARCAASRANKAHSSTRSVNGACRCCSHSREARHRHCAGN
jgi:hypothetical protein